LLECARFEIILPVLPAIRVRAVVLNGPDPLALSGFYAELLGWPPDPELDAENRCVRGELDSLVDDRPQVGHSAALAAHVVSWLRDEEATMPATCDGSGDQGESRSLTDHSCCALTWSGTGQACLSHSFPS
jgi:hypothetical protein